MIGLHITIILDFIPYEKNIYKDFVYIFKTVKGFSKKNFKFSKK